MNLIKLDAINSTNDFLKQLSNDSTVKNYTVVTAESQTEGKGQMGTKWVSETSKNLIVSILIKDVLINNNQIFNLNIAVATAIYDALNYFQIPNLSIKWANDILSGNKKIAGILIENVIKSDGKIISIIGFGMNVNQTNFDDLPQASSLKNITGKDFDREELLLKIFHRIQKNILQLKDNQNDMLWNTYNNLLFKKGVPSVFEADNHKFMGIIHSVSTDGKLELLLENDHLQSFEIKEIKMIY
jgi:BirA family transcriptional regulator, biotin operon repressor / biotin---[acetyl-CoA-carboxylase] ligase